MGAALNTMELLRSFDRCVKWECESDGTVSCVCKVGLWSVYGKDREWVEREARHYWIQYFEDGEYNELLGVSALRGGEGE